MPDTHDANNQPLTVEEWNHLAASIYHLSGPDAWDDDQLEPALIPVTHYVPRLMAGFMAAVARAEKAESRLVELGEPETQQRVIGVSGLAYTPTELDLQHRSEWRSGVRLEERQVHPTPWREVAAATSADLTDYGGGWSSRRPDASLDGLRGPFTGLLGPLGIAADAVPDGQAGPDSLPVADCPSPYRDGTCHHLTCARCKEHTNNNSQGHWWAYCKVTGAKREFHFCCPGDCELEPPNIRHDDTNGADQ